MSVASGGFRAACVPCECETHQRSFEPFVASRRAASPTAAHCHRRRLPPPSHWYSRPKELRQLKAQLGVLAAADGSALFEMGNTKVLAAVFGPKPVEQRSQEDERRCIVKCEYAMATFSTGKAQAPMGVEGGGRGGISDVQSKCEYAMATFDWQQQLRGSSRAGRCGQHNPDIPPTSLSIYLPPPQASGGGAARVIGEPPKSQKRYA